MFARLTNLRKVALRITLLFSALWLAACDVPGGNSGQTIDPNAPIPVALLVPRGSGGDAIISRHLENAARMAISDLQGVSVNLKVYSTGGGNPQQAAVAAQKAVSEGAKIIIGPLYSEASNAAGLAATSAGVNVLSFSNTPTIAGGNVFVMGPLFQTTAKRLVRYGTSQGIVRYYAAGSNDLAGELGMQAIVNAVSSSGGQTVGTKIYPLSQADISAAAGSIAREAAASGAQAVFLAASQEPEVAMMGTFLPEKGLRNTRIMGLTQWNTTNALLSIPGLQGGLFATPDTARANAFSARYRAAFGEAPNPRASLAYDAIAAIGALAATGDRGALTSRSLTRRSGFVGASGIFRLLPNGLNERGLAVATLENGKVRVISPAPTSFSGGF